MDRQWWTKFYTDILGGKNLKLDDARRIAEFGGPDIMDLLALANRLNWAHKGNKISFCAIINARSGKCSEDCAFCAQSAHYDTGAPEYGMVEVPRMADAARRAKEGGAIRFSIVTSGLGLTERNDIGTAREGIRAICREGIRACASVGILDTEALLDLKKAGLSRYHHNLETAPSFFDKICTTHRYEDDVKTIRTAKSLGIETCCGGIFGMGESWEQRIEFLFFIAALEPDSVPLNFLTPIPGTPLGGISDLTPTDCLKIIAMTRLILPKADVVLCGGREMNLRDMQSMTLFAGANGIMTGDYLTTPGRAPELDRKMVEEAGLEIEALSC